MDESGGSGHPRPGNEGANDREAAPTARTADPAHPEHERDGIHRQAPQGPREQTAAASSPQGPPQEPSGPRGENEHRPPTDPADHIPPDPDGPAVLHRSPDHSDGPSAPGPHDDHQGSPPAGDHPAPDAPARPPGQGHPAEGGRIPPPEGPAHPRDPADTPPTGHPAVHGPGRSLAHSAPDGPGRPPQRPKEPGGGILMGRPFGVPVYVAPSWFLVAALITWVFGGQLDRVLPQLGAARYLVSLFFAVAFYASVLVHELAHTVAALRFKLPVRRIQLQFFGGVSEIEKEAETPGREFVLAFVGPLFSLVLAGVFYLAMQPVRPGTVPGVLLAGLMISNLIVAVFNLLPGLPLDGGRMLRAVVWKITGRPMSGTVAAAWVGRALAIAVLVGLPLLTQSGALGSTAEDNVGMDTVTDALLAAILAAIIWTGAGNSLRMARLREHLPELRARSLTRRAVPVQGDTPLSEALRRANEVGARALVVVDAHGRPLSLVREAAIVGVPEHRRPWVPVSGLAQELNDGMRVSAELAGEALLDVLRATPATEYLVVEETGEIYGVLSAADVERAFVKAMARPS